MGNCDSMYTLEGMIEFDEAYFTVESNKIEQKKGIHGKKGAVGLANIQGIKSVFSSIAKDMSWY